MGIYSYNRLSGVSGFKLTPPDAVGPDGIDFAPDSVARLREVMNSRGVENSLDAGPPLSLAVRRRKGLVLFMAFYGIAIVFHECVSIDCSHYIDVFGCTLHSCLHS